MKRLYYLIVLTGITCSLTAQSASVDTEITFYAKDSVLIHGDLFHINKSSPVILLFHQGRSNGRGEYAELVPKLLNKGYNVLLIDLRRGGQLYGQYNRTVAKFAINNYSYCDTYPDFEGALDYIVDAGYLGKKVLWGSSYSASLAIRIAHARPQDVTAVLAFSPSSGGPMQDCKPDDLFETLRTPLFLLRPAKEMEIESVAAQMSRANEAGHQTQVVENGVHGSSMMIASRVNGSVSSQWKMVHDFLDRNLNP